jgi:peptide subunit release factor 1 (eRF1)
MVTYEDLQILKSYQPHGNGYVLSIYLNTDQSKATNLNRGFERSLGNLLRSLEQELTDPQARQALALNREKVLKFVQNYTPRKKALLIFSDATRDFWWEQELTIDLPDLARFSPILFLRPLIAALDEHERYGVVLIDKGRARLCTVYLGEIEEHEGVFEEVPPVTQTAGRDRIIAQKRMQRHHDEHVLWHAKQVAERLRDLTDRYRFDRLVIGGSLEAVSELQHVLPKPLHRLVIGTFSLPIQASHQDVLSETKQIEATVEREEEVKLVEALITAGHKGDKATLGLADTVQATNEGRVWQLIYEKNFFSQGFRCSQCDMLYAENRPEKCVYCGGALSHTPNLISQVIERVINAGGQVEEVHNQAAVKLATRGHIGAFLRY